MRCHDAISQLLYISSLYRRVMRTGKLMYISVQICAIFVFINNLFRKVNETNMNGEEMVEWQYKRKKIFKNRKKRKRAMEAMESVHRADGRGLK